MMASPQTAMVQPAPRGIRGQVRPPGDKAISHRYALLAALADGRSEIRGYSTGGDCASTLTLPSRPGRHHRRDRTRRQRPDAVDDRARPRRPDRAGRPPRCGEFRQHHAHARRYSVGASLLHHDDRRRVAAAPSDAAGHRAARTHGCRASVPKTAVRRSRFRARPPSSRSSLPRRSPAPRSRPRFSWLVCTQTGPRPCTSLWPRGIIRSGRCTRSVCGSRSRDVLSL